MYVCVYVFSPVFSSLPQPLVPPSRAKRRARQRPGSTSKVHWSFSCPGSAMGRITAESFSETCGVLGAGWEDDYSDCIYIYIGCKDPNSGDLGLLTEKYLCVVFFVRLMTWNWGGVLQKLECIGLFNQWLGMIQPLHTVNPAVARYRLISLIQWGKCVVYLIANQQKLRSSSPTIWWIWLLKTWLWLSKSCT